MKYLIGCLLFLTSNSYAINDPIDLFETTSEHYEKSLTNVNVVKIDEQSVNKFKKFAHAVYVKPSRYDVTLGIIFFTLRGVVSSRVFLTSPNIPKEMAIALILVGSLMTGVNNVYHQTLANVFMYNLENRNKYYRYTIEYIRSLSYDVLMGNIFNGVSRKNSVLQTTINSVLSNVVSSAFSTQRARILKRQRKIHLMFPYKLLINPIGFYIQSLETTGSVAPLFVAMGYQFRYTQLSNVIMFISLMGINYFFKDDMIKVLEYLNGYTTKIVDGICNNILHTKKIENGEDGKDLKDY
jgi:hypothetical protein